MKKKHVVLWVHDAAGAPHPRLAPASDVLPTNSGQGQQVFEVGLEGCDFTPIKHMPQRNLFALSGTHAGREVAAASHVVDSGKTHFATCDVTARERA